MDDWRLILICSADCDLPRQVAIAAKQKGINLNKLFN